MRREAQPAARQKHLTVGPLVFDVPLPAAGLSAYLEFEDDDLSTKSGARGLIKLGAVSGGRPNSLTLPVLHQLTGTVTDAENILQDPDWPFLDLSDEILCDDADAPKSLFFDDSVERGNGRLFRTQPA